MHVRINISFTPTVIGIRETLYVNSRLTKIDYSEIEYQIVVTVQQ